LVTAEKAGQQKVELAPEFPQVVLQWRASQAEAVTRFDPTHHFSTLTARVLHRLRLVENQQVIGVPGQVGNVAP